MTKKIEEIVRKEAGEPDWNYHIAPVRKYALRLATKYGANKQVVEVAALLHDIGRIKYGPKNHEETGAEEAKKILIKYKYNQKIIDDVLYCIRSHKGADGVQPKTIEAEILINADAMAHFNVLPLFFYDRDANVPFAERIAWVEKKITNGWKRKLTLKESRKMTQEKYQAIKLILKSIKDLV
ncbi:MAG TPA: HD domain-containing protein [bacterium]|nr:HD domain-containing protein [bacterium]